MKNRPYCSSSETRKVFIALSDNAFIHPLGVRVSYRGTLYDSKETLIRVLSTNQWVMTTVETLENNDVRGENGNTRLQIKEFNGKTLGWLTRVSVQDVLKMGGNCGSTDESGKEQPIHLLKQYVFDTRGCFIRDKIVGTAELQGSIFQHPQKSTQDKQYATVLCPTDQPFKTVLKLIKEDEWGTILGRDEFKHKVKLQVADMQSLIPNFLSTDKVIEAIFLALENELDEDLQDLRPEVNISTRTPIAVVPYTTQNILSHILDELNKSTNGGDLPNRNLKTVFRSYISYLNSTFRQKCKIVVVPQFFKTERHFVLLIANRANFSISIFDPKQYFGHHQEGPDERSFILKYYAKSLEIAFGEYGKWTINSFTQPIRKWKYADMRRSIALQLDDDNCGTLIALAFEVLSGRPQAIRMEASKNHLFGRFDFVRKRHFYVLMKQKVQPLAKDMVQNNSQKLERQAAEILQLVAEIDKQVLRNPEDREFRTQFIKTTLLVHQTSMNVAGIPFQSPLKTIPKELKKQDDSQEFALAFNAWRDETISSQNKQSSFSATQVGPSHQNLSPLGNLSSPSPPASSSIPNSPTSLKYRETSFSAKIDGTTNKDDDEQGPHKKSTLEPDSSGSTQSPSAVFESAEQQSLVMTDDQTQGGVWSVDADPGVQQENPNINAIVTKEPNSSGPTSWDNKKGSTFGMEHLALKQSNNMQQEMKAGMSKSDLGLGQMTRERFLQLSLDEIELLGPEFDNLYLGKMPLEDSLTIKVVCKDIKSLCHPSCLNNVVVDAMFGAEQQFGALSTSTNKSIFKPALYIPTEILSRCLKVQGSLKVQKLFSLQHRETILNLTNKMTTQGRGLMVLYNAGNVHWCMVFVKLQGHRIDLYDPEKTSKHIIVDEGAIHYMRFVRKLVSSALQINENLWNRNQGADWPKNQRYFGHPCIPRQTDGYDCGVFVKMRAELFNSKPEPDLKIIKALGYRNYVVKNMEIKKKASKFIRERI